MTALLLIVWLIGGIAFAFNNGPHYVREDFYFDILVGMLVLGFSGTLFILFLQYAGAL